MFALPQTFDLCKHTGITLHDHSKTTIPVSFLTSRKETPMYGVVKRLTIDLQKQILQECSSLLSAAPLYSNYAPRRGIGRRDCSGNCETCFTGGNVRQAKYKNTSFGSWGYYAPPVRIQIRPGASHNRRAISAHSYQHSRSVHRRCN